jgi:hypothetical protein
MRGAKSSQRYETSKMPLHSRDVNDSIGYFGDKDGRSCPLRKPSTAKYNASSQYSKRSVKNDWSATETDGSVSEWPTGKPEEPDGLSEPAVNVRVEHNEALRTSATH